MPRVSAAHEQEVRDRILDAAARVFAEKGYHSSTIADVVRESGLSVGAIYIVLLGQGRADPPDLRPDRRAAASTSSPRGWPRPRPPQNGWRSPSASTSRRSTSTTAPPGRSTLVQAWAEADREPGVREMLAGRRERLAGAGQLLLRQGVISGELPAWLDVDAVTRALLALLDGLMLQRIEAGDAYRPADLERRAMAMVELLLGARSMTAGAPGPQEAVATA